MKIKNSKMKIILVMLLLILLTLIVIILNKRTTETTKKTEVRQIMLFKKIAKPGDYVQYDGGNGYTGLWQVLYNDDINKIQIITSEATGGVTLEIDSKENAKEVYEQATDVINNYCKKYVNYNYAESGRSIGINMVNTEKIIYEKIKRVYNLPDYEAMTKATSQNEEGIAKTNQNYWIAVKHVDELRGTKMFSIYTDYGYHTIYETMEDEIVENTVVKNLTYAVRPVITLKNEIQTDYGDGSKENPFILIPIK